jgi:hypothetical protein
MVEAIGCQASGYVLKTCMKNDLVSTLEHALANRVCLPAVSPLAAGDSCGHALLLYKHEPAFFDAVAGFLSAALHRDDVVALTLTETARDRVAQRLRNQGWDLDRLRTECQYLEFDSIEAASSLVRNGRLDMDYVDGVFDSFEQQRLASKRGAQSRLTFCGSIAPLLAAAGSVDAAAELERAWGDRTRGLPYLTLCAYALDSLRGGEARARLQSVCAAHTYVSDAGAGVWARGC